MEAEEENPKYYIIIQASTHNDKTRQQGDWYVSKRNEKSMLFFVVVGVAFVSTASMHIHNTHRNERHLIRCSCSFCRSIASCRPKYVWFDFSCVFCVAVSALTFVVFISAVFIIITIKHILLLAFVVHMYFWTACFRINSFACAHYRLSFAATNNLLCK